MKTVWVYVDTSKQVGDPITSRSLRAAMLPMHGLSRTIPRALHSNTRF